MTESTIYLVQSRRPGGDWQPEVYRTTEPAAEQWIHTQRMLTGGMEYIVRTFVGGYPATLRSEDPLRVRAR